MTKQEAIDLLDNLIGMIEDNHGSDYDSAIRMAIDALESKWIPCSERLPKESGSYFVSGKWASGKIVVGDCEYSKDDGYFRTSWNFDVLAWMPLPDPWNEEEG